VCAAFALPLSAALPLALWAGLMPSHQGFLLLIALDQSGPENLVRPLSFLLVSAIVATISAALKRQAAREASFSQLLQAQMQQA